MPSREELRARARRLIGSVLRDKWRIDALLGIGGMAAVYAATHKNNGKRAAIKLMHPEVSVDDDVRGRFLREGYVANKVDHPGVCGVLDDDKTDDGALFLVMDLLEGQTLKERAAKPHGPMEVREVLEVAQAVLDVLVAAHEKGIIHRDLKPENIFITEDGRVQVLDFGIARLRELASGGDPTQTDTMMGTPAFMSPEQARARWDWVDGRSDLWSLGATMFTLLTGEYVHSAETVTELLVEAATAPARSVADVRGDLATDVVSIVDTALAFEQAKRFQKASEMRDAVAAVLAAEPKRAPHSREDDTQTLTIEGPTPKRVTDPAGGAVVAPETPPPSGGRISAPVVAPPIRARVPVAIPQNVAPAKPASALAGLVRTVEMDPAANPMRQPRQTGSNHTVPMPATPAEPPPSPSLPPPKRLLRTEALPATPTAPPPVVAAPPRPARSPRPQALVIVLALAVAASGALLLSRACSPKKADAPHGKVR